MYRATDVKLGLSTGTVEAQPNASNISTQKYCHRSAWMSVLHLNRVVGDFTRGFQAGLGSH